MPKIFILCLAMMLTGCAATRLTEADEKQIKNVALVNLVPEEANFVKVGLTVFNNERGEIDMKGKANETIESVVKKRLAVSRPEWNIKNIPYDHVTLINKLKSSGIVIAHSEEKIEKELAELVRVNGLDALLVVRAQQYNPHIGDGVGIFLRTMNLSSIQYAEVHSNVSLKVVGRTGRVIAGGISTIPENIKPIEPTKYGFTYELKENYRPELIEQLRVDIADQLTRSLNRRFDILGM